jgi:DNA-binding MarR family transcriptional regulator
LEPAPGPPAAELLADLVPRLYRLLRTALDDEGLPSLEQLRVLHRIDTGILNVSGLAAARQMRQSAITAIVDVLETKRWVVRERDPSDGRRTTLVMTSAGRAALRDGRRATGHRMAEILELVDVRDGVLGAALTALDDAVDRFDESRALAATERISSRRAGADRPPSRAKADDDQRRDDR